MLSTYLSYRLHTQDIAKSLDRLEVRQDVSRDTKYYQENIGKVSSVDEFLKDDRLYSYAMKALGLEDMIYAKAFMRKVLESDLADANSFARKLVDTRYVDFAQSFSFTSKGGVHRNLSLAQSEFQVDDTTGLYSAQRVKKGAAASSEAQYYQTRIATVSSVDDLIADKRLLSYALTAFKIDPSIASETAIRNVLTSDLADPGSYANQIADPKYRSLAAAFSFAADGTVPAGSLAQSNAQLSETIHLNYDNSGSGSSPAAAAFRTEYYSAHIDSVGSVDDLLNNDRLFAFALTAHGINPNITAKSTIRDVLLSDLADPASFANASGNPRFQALAAAFNFDSTGAVDGSEGPQSDDQLDATTVRYLDAYDDTALTSESLATNAYRNRINFMTSVDQLMSDTTVYDYVLKAFGLDPDKESKGTIKQVLLSDAGDPRSFANTHRDKRYRELAAAFNFGAGGTVLQPRAAQVESEESATVALYKSRFGTSDAEKAQMTAETKYYQAEIGKVRSVDDFLSDKRLVAYVMKAYDLESERLANDTLRKIMTSDAMDKDSYVNKQFKNDNRMRDLAAAFNFTVDGKLDRGPAQEAQSTSKILKVSDAYTRQVLEVEAGDQNEGVRLALYFQRKAEDIKTPYDILADKALLEVVRTALGLPESMSQSGIEKQADMISKKLNIADLQDEQKLEKFIARFTTMYDMNQNATSGPSVASMILDGIASNARALNGGNR